MNFSTRVLLYPPSPPIIPSTILLIVHGSVRTRCCFRFFNTLSPSIHCSATLFIFPSNTALIVQRYQPGAGWGSSDEDHLLPEDRAPLTGASGVHAIDDLDDISPSSLGSAYCWEGEEGDGDEEGDEDEGGWNAGPWTYAERFAELPEQLPRAASPALLTTDLGSSPKSPPPPPPDRPAGVRSRVWWRAMVVARGANVSMGRASSGGSRSSRRDSSGFYTGPHPRRKVPHTAMSSSPGGGGQGAAGRGDRIRVPLDKLRRAAVVGPSTLIVELDVEAKITGGVAGGGWQPATLIIGPCDAPRLGSLLAERTATAPARTALGQVVRRAKKLADRPPPLPPRPSARRIGADGGSGRSGNDASATASHGEYRGRAGSIGVDTSAVYYSTGNVLLQLTFSYTRTHSRSLSRLVLLATTILREKLDAVTPCLLPHPCTPAPNSLPIVHSSVTKIGELAI